MGRNLKYSIILIFTLLLMGVTASCSQNIGSKIVSTVSCTGDSTPASVDAASAQTASAETENTPYSIDVFTMLGNYSGDQQGWFAKIVRDKFNINMKIISSNVEGGGDAKFTSMIASGDLGDLVIYGSDTDNKWLDSIKGGYLLDMAKDGLIDKCGNYITGNFPKVIEKNRVEFGNGKSVYGLGYKAANMPPGPSEGKDMTEHSDMRWDLYEQLGRPVIKSPEEMLEVLAKMQQLDPKSETGKPTYAFSMWSDWDGTMMMYTKAFAALFGYDEGDGYNSYGFLLFNPDGDMQGCLDTDGWYVRTLRLFFKAGQLGLVDPDSISQKYEDIVNKYKDGQLLFSLFPWVDNVYNTPERLAKGMAMYFVPISGEKVISYGFSNYGADRLISIGAKAKYPERIMSLINWTYTPEGFMTIMDGPRGLTWDVNAKGKPYLTDFGKQALPNNETPVPVLWGGGNYRDGISQWNIEPIDANSINPEFGEPYDFQQWTSVLNSGTPKVLMDWRAAMGGTLTVKDYLEKNNMLAIKQPVFMGKAPDVMSDSLNLTQSLVSAVIREYSWRCVFAADESAFNTLLHEMTVKAKSLGYDDVLKWNMVHGQQVLDFLKSRKK